MAHYGSDVIDWWNKAFQEMKENGKYKKMCETSSLTHGEFFSIVVMSHVCH